MRTVQPTPDALVIGPFVLEWGRLSLILGVIAFTTLIARMKNPKLERGAWIGLIVALVAGRIGYGVTADALGLMNLLDPRVGGLAWVWSLVAGIIALAWALRLEAARLIPAGLIALVIAFVPQLLRPATDHLKPLPPEARLERLGGTSITQNTWKDVHKPVLVNVWATWCGPCRSEMPVLAREATRGARLLFLNAGEDAATIRAFLEREHLPLTVYRDLENLRGTLEVSGLPTTIVIGVDGRVKARHLGPLDRAQLQELLGMVR